MAVECYMTQHGGTKEEAIDVFQKQITDAWKDINKECLHPTTVPMPLLIRILNFSQVSEIMYKDEENYTHAEIVLKDFVASLSLLILCQYNHGPVQYCNSRTFHM